VIAPGLPPPPNNPTQPAVVHAARAPVLAFTDPTVFHDAALACPRARSARWSRLVQVQVDADPTFPRTPFDRFPSVTGRRLLPDPNLFVRRELFRFRPRLSMTGALERPGRRRWAPIAAREGYADPERETTVFARGATAQSRVTLRTASSRHPRSSRACPRRARISLGTGRSTCPAWRGCARAARLDVLPPLVLRRVDGAVSTWPWREWPQAVIPG